MSNPLTARKNLWFHILITGFIAGSLDAAAAACLYVLRTGKNPIRVFEFIASGVFGQEAFSGGGWMPVLGLLFHFLIASTWALLYFIAFPKINLLKENKIANAIGYGALIWLFMNLIVLPLSNAPTIPFNITQSLLGAAVLMACVGLPISFLCQRYYAAK